VGIVLLVLSTGFRAALPKKSEPVPVMEFVVNTVPDEPESSPVSPFDFSPPPPPEPAVHDIPEEQPKPRQKPKPPDVRKPKPVKKPIVPSNRKITRRADSSRRPEKRLSPEEVARLLAMGARAGDHTVIPADEEVRCYTVIRQAFYDAWGQPSRDEVPPGATAEASIRVLWDGTVADRRVTRRSGNPVLDGSVQQALNSVRRIEGLTRAFVRKHDTVAITFRLEE
jgi:outer membrane biosynthesis protein TonB